MEAATVPGTEVPAVSKRQKSSLGELVSTALESLLFVETQMVTWLLG